MTNSWAVDVLIEKLQDREPFVRAHAATLLGGLGAEAHRAVPVLIGMLTTGAVEDRRLAALTLGEIGSAAEVALAALLMAAHGDGDAIVEREASAAVERIYREGSEREAA
jgi:HEAT repeat protein